MKVFKVLFILACFFSTTLYAQKTHEWRRMINGGYSYEFVTNDLTNTRFYTLKNGLTVILSPNKKEPRISTQIAVRTGSNNDPKDHTGLAHYLEHLLFKGTDQFGSLNWAREKPVLDSITNLYEEYTLTTDVNQRNAIYSRIDQASGRAAKFAIAGEYDNLMKAIGSQGTNAHTSVEETVYNEDIPANAIDKFLDIQAERFRNPIFRIFHTELEAVYEEKNRSLDNDANKMQEAMFSTIFPTHNYGLQTTIGTIEHLKNPSLKAIGEYYQKYYVPNNMAIIMAGDFDPDELVKKIDQRFSYMKPRPIHEYKGTVEKPIAGPIVKEVFGPGAESVRILYRGYPSGTREALLTDLVSAVLSNGRAGLMDLNLNKQQKTAGAGTAHWQFKDYGLFFINASAKQGQTLEEVKEILLEQVSILKTGSFDESLIKAIAANYKLSQLQSLESNSARADNMTDQFIKNRGKEWNKDVATIDEISRVSKKELVAFANQFFGDKNYAILYKRKGEDQRLIKVDKPSITPVETNAGQSSKFVQSITKSPMSPIQPLWLDYTKDLQKARLGNADVLYVQNIENGLFSLSYQFDLGSWNNKLLPLAAAYLQYLGTGKFSAEEISKKFYNLACDFKFSPGTQQTVISISGLQENFEKAVSLFEELLANCQADDGALEGLKNLIMKSRANSKLNKGTVASALQSYALYGAKNPFNNVLTDEELNALKAEDLTDLLHSFKNHEHKITYYGPQPLAAITSQLQTLHKLPVRWTSNPQPVRFQRADQTANQVLFSHYDAVQAEIYWLRNGKAYDHQSEALVKLFNGYFGGGMGSVVFSTIRESRALAYSTYAVVQTPGRQEEPFSTIAYVGCQADKMNEAVMAMNELLNELPLTEKNFENVRTGLLKDIETDRITKGGVIGSYLQAGRKGLNYDLRKENYEQYKILKLEDIRKYHQQEVANKPYTYCVVASDKRISMDDLKKYGELKILSLEELFGY